jgi:hypothetical protein
VTPQRPSVHRKALQINIDATVHGTFAEIGAGQEVVRWFFHVGGAASTVAKTISAYDMQVSDAIYGSAKRYVSKERLQAMLDYEYDLLVQRLDRSRGDMTAFFAFANTVATSSYSRHDEGHGWVGLKFQHRPKNPPSQITLHARLLDAENPRQQGAVGTLGVNLLYAAYYLHGDLPILIASLADELSRERIEIDMVDLSGPCFQGTDNRLMSLQLVEQNLTDAVLFTAEGAVVEAADLLHQKPVLVERGSFRPITNTTLDMLERAEELLRKELPDAGDEVVALAEMTLRNLMEGDEIVPTDFLARVDVLSALGKTVMVSRHAHHYRMATHIRRYTAKPLGFVLGIPALRELFEEKYYAHLDGGILEAFGRLFKSGVKLYVYPSKDPGSDRLITADNLDVDPHLKLLYAFLRERGLLRAIENVDASEVRFLPADVQALIERGDPAWEEMVPAAAARIIKDRALFGYKPGPNRRGSRP